MNNQKGITSLKWIVVVVIVAGVAVGGVLAYKYKDWTSPTPEPGTWSGTITSVDIGEKIIEAQGINQTIRSSVLDGTIIEDEQGNPISLEFLKEGDFISISGIYQMAGKMTSEWEVVITADKVKVLGECIKEGEEETSGMPCCPGLTLLDQKYCTKCGDDICKSPENQENCPLDCTKISEPITVSIFIHPGSFDLNNKSFEGMTRPRQTGEGTKEVKITTTDSTKFYRMADGPNSKEYFTFSEFYSLIENWSGPSWPFTVNGILEEESIIKANEVYYSVQ